MENLCNTCPRKCNINRDKNLGFCKSSNKIKIAKVMMHFFEEPFLCGEKDKNKPYGSGAIFFSNCTLKCVYCQNFEISSGGQGKEITPKELSEIFKDFEQKNACNINLVTPTHFTNQIIEALQIYHPKIPIVWNTSGYEDPETIKKLKGYVDIFLTDFKYFSPHLSKKYSFAQNYPDACKNSILEMKKIAPKDEFENGIMKKGLVVRHLVLPELTKDSLNVINWVYENLGNETYFSLMSQYVPMGNAKNYPEINRKITPLEYKILVNKLVSLGFTNALIQDFDSADTCFTPNFKEDL